MHNDRKTDTKPRTHCLSILLIVFALAIVVAPIAANAQTRSFMTVDCDNISLIEGELLFLRSTHGFVYKSSSGSRLQEAFPQEVGGDKGIPGRQSVQTIVIQQIPTNDLGFKRLEGGIPGTILFVIAGGVIGALIAPLFRKNSVVFGLGGLLVGYLASIVIMGGIFGVEDNDMTFTVDNAGDNEVSVTIGQYPAVPIPAKSQMSFGIEEGTKEIVIRETGGGNRTESFTLSAMKALDSDGKPSYTGYVINVFGVNKYRVEKAAYVTK